MATVQNITIDQGTTFSLTINLTNDDNSAKNLANYTIASQMRKSYEGTTKNGLYYGKSRRNRRSNNLINSSSDDIS